MGSIPFSPDTTHSPPQKALGEPHMRAPTGVYEQDAAGRWTTVPHGTYSRYTHGHCRCAECREANRIACWLRRNGQGPGRKPLGHNVGRYLKGCRCDECKAAKSLWQSRYYATKLVRAAGDELGCETASQPMPTVSRSARSAGSEAAGRDHGGS